MGQSSRVVPAVDCAALTIPESFYSRVVIVDGRLDVALSDTSALPAVRVAEENDAISLHVFPGAETKTPLQIIVFSLLHRRLQLHLGKGASLHLVMTMVGQGSSLITTLEEKAQLHMFEEIRYPIDMMHSFRANLESSSLLSGFFYSKGSFRRRRNIDIVLQGEGAEASLQGLDLIEGEGEAETHVFADHRAPRCRSKQHFRKALCGKGRSNFEGAITVRSEAQGSEAVQLNQNLLLHEGAYARAQPVLQLFTGQAKAKHGAVFSLPNDEELFYARSRGLSDREAKELLLRGFCQQMIEAIDIPSFQERLR